MTSESIPFKKIKGVINLYAGILDLNECEPDEERLNSLRYNIFKLYLQIVTENEPLLSDSERIALEELASVQLK